MSGLKFTLSYVTSFLPENLSRLKIIYKLYIYIYNIYIYIYIYIQDYVIYITLLTNDI